MFPPHDLIGCSSPTRHANLKTVGVLRLRVNNVPLNARLAIDICNLQRFCYVMNPIRGKPLPSLRLTSPGWDRPTRPGGLQTDNPVTVC